MNKKTYQVLVIGGAVFLGSHVADELSRRGHKVKIFDVVPSPWVRGDQEMIVADINDQQALDRALQGVDYLYHFAGIADISASKIDPINTIQQNIMGLSRVIQAAASSEIKRFLFASTMYVYSDYGSFYRATKQASEILIETYSKEFNISYSFLRYGSLYGPRSQDWNGLRSYVAQAINNQHIKYDGTGNELREYIHVNDAARLSVDLLDQDAYANTAVNITGQEKYSIDNLLNLIFEILGKKVAINYREEEVNNLRYKITPYRYTPKFAKKLVPNEYIDLGQGVLELIEEIQHELNFNENK